MMSGAYFKPNRLNRCHRVAAVVCCASMLFASGVHSADWRGAADLEFRWFADDPLDPRQPSDNFSASFEPEFNHSWNDGRDSFTFRPFVRIDQHDDERTHGDIRELAWIRAADEWELRVGIRKVFWGVTEGQHLVDIINQTDGVENLDGEDKLGQPMINFAVIKDWGTLDFYALTGFRERTFAGAEGRPRSQLLVNTSATTWESDAEDSRIDLALRYSHTVGDFDIGVSHFRGTSRDPRFNPVVSATGEVQLAPHYDVIDQTGIDIQATRDAWLWKLEAIRRSGQGDTYWAATAGFEYTFFGIFDSAADLGVLFEYLYDSRGATAATPFEDDVLVGARLALNDTQSTDLLFGVIVDADGDARSYSLEASRRIGDRLKFSLEGRVFSGISENDALYGFRQDDYLQLTFGWFF